MKKCKVNEIKLFDAKCNLPSLKDDINDLCLLHSENPNKDLKKFKHKIIKKLEDDDYDFSAIYFPSAIEFPIDFQFTKKTSFFSATFLNNANFFRSIFNEEVDFNEVIFNEKAIFISVIFLNGADFSAAIFRKEANFFASRLSGEITFFDTYFQDKANFSGAILTGSADIIFANVSTIKDSSEQKFYGDFSGLEIHPEALLKFENISLSNVIFKHTDLRKIKFYNVTWHRHWWRDAIYDEVLINNKEIHRTSSILMRTSYLADILPNLIGEDLPEKPSSDDYAAVEELYRYLKINYETEGDFKKVGDFHYGEKEMHRRASRWLWFPCYWYNLYWFLSGYGERPSRALGWLAGFLLALPLIVWGFGLDRVAGGTTPGFLETFTYIFEKATFQRPPLLSNLNLLGTFISNLSLLLIPGQAALFLLALRNRLGRRR